MKAAFVICVALALPACKDHELAKLQAVRDEVCACKTPQCADAAMGKLPAKNVQSTPKSQQLARAMLDCLADLYATPTPSLDPDAEIEPAPAGTEPAPAGTEPAPAGSAAAAGSVAPAGSAAPTGP